MLLAEPMLSGMIVVSEAGGQFDRHQQSAGRPSSGHASEGRLRLSV
jgi:hypothetical protein